MYAFFRIILRLRLLLALVGILGVSIDQSLGGKGQWVNDSKAWIRSLESTADAPAEAENPVITPTATESPLTPPPAPAAPAWTPPAIIPAIPGGTLITPDAIYSNARIVQMDADRVTILHDGGRAVIPTWQLPASLQQQLNYDPKAAESAASQHQSTEAPVEAAMARQDEVNVPQVVPQLNETTDYASGLSSAKATGRKVLLDFTGSDSCAFCRVMQKEVFSTPKFNQFAASNYVIVTVDFPQNIPQPESLKDQNNRLAQKYHVGGYPTLVVITPDERELDRISSYEPGSGPDDVIRNLRSYSGN